MLPALLGGPCARAIEQRARRVGLTQAPEEHAEALLEIGDRGRVPGQLVLDRGQGGLGLLEGAAHRVRVRERKHRVDAAAVGHGQLAQLRAERGVAGEVGGARGVDQQRRRDRRARVEQQPHDAQGVVGRQRAALLERRRQAQPQRAAAQPGHARAQDVAVQRVREPDVLGARAGVDRDQPVRFRVGERVIGRQPLDLRHRERLRQREQLDGGALLAGELVDPAADELDQRRGHRRRPREPPEAAIGDQAAAVDGAEHELARVQRIALAAIEHPALRLLLHGPTERGLDQRPHRLVAEALQLEPLRAAVLPQRDDRVRARLARAHRGDDEHAGPRRQVQHERSGRGIEQLGVVDAEHDRASRGALAQQLRALAQEVERLLGAHGRRQQTGEGAERDHRRAARRLHPLRHRALVFELGQNLASEARLADAGACSDDDAAPLLDVCPRDRRQLVVAADQRPIRSHRGLMHGTRTLRLRVGAVNPQAVAAARGRSCRRSDRGPRRPQRAAGHDDVLDREGQGQEAEDRAARPRPGSSP